MPGWFSKTVRLRTATDARRRAAIQVDLIQIDLIQIDPTQVEEGALGGTGIRVFTAILPPWVADGDPAQRFAIRVRAGR
jgi:hypothetical protein